MTTKQIIDMLTDCPHQQDCETCGYRTVCNGFGFLFNEASERLKELVDAVEQKNDVSQETANSQEETPETGVQLEPERATKYISISVAEYHCLTKAATMLEVILADKTFTHENVVAAVHNAVGNMCRALEGREDT